MMSKHQDRKHQDEEKIRSMNRELIEQYPFLLPRNVWTDEIVSDYNYDFTEYDDIEDGWQIGFGEFLLDDLKQALIETDYLDKFRFMQIKEKYGSLRIYTNAVPQKVNEVLDKYEFISQYICMICGSPYASIVNNYGWYMPMCKDCWDKSNQKREGKGYRIVSYEEAIGGGKCVLPNNYTVERYSNGKTETIVYDISDTVEKIMNRYNERKANKENKC